MHPNFFRFCKLCYLVFQVIPFVTNGQDIEIEKASLLEQKGRYANAWEIYDKKISSNFYEPNILPQAANCLKMMGLYEASANLYNMASTSLEPFPDSLLYKYAEVLQQSDQFNQAKICFLKLLNSNFKKQEVLLKVANCDSALIWVSETASVKVKNLSSINTKYSEIGPVKYKNNLVFSGEREGTIISKKTNKWNTPFYDLFVAENINNTFTRPKNFSKAINTRWHEGPATFSAAFDTIYFSRNSENFKDNHLNLFSSVHQGNTWMTPLHFMMNDSTSSFAHPCISPDGNLFFFSSDLPGGYGGIDIYVCIKSDSNWSLPVNLGEKINTSGNEIFPHYTSDGSLYFSSDNWPGMGGFDIYFSEQTTDGDWGTAKNLKYPVNSGADDFSFIPFPKWPFGIFSSNRVGGVGSDDLYLVEP